MPSLFKSLGLKNRSKSNSGGKKSLSGGGIFRSNRDKARQQQHPNKNSHHQTKLESPPTRDDVDYAIQQDLTWTMSDDTLEEIGIDSIPQFQAVPSLPPEQIVDEVTSSIATAADEIHQKKEEVPSASPPEIVNDAVASIATCKGGKFHQKEEENEDGKTLIMTFTSKEVAQNQLNHMRQIMEKEQEIEEIRKYYSDEMERMKQYAATREEELKDHYTTLIDTMKVDTLTEVEQWYSQQMKDQANTLAQVDQELRETQRKLRAVTKKSNERKDNLRLISTKLMETQQILFEERRQHQQQQQMRRMTLPYDNDGQFLLMETIIRRHVDYAQERSFRLCNRVADMKPIALIGSGIIAIYHLLMIRQITSTTTGEIGMEGEV